MFIVRIRRAWGLMTCARIRTSILSGEHQEELAMKKFLQTRNDGGLILRRRGSQLQRNGFTLIELMIVIMIILILIGMAVGRYDKSVIRAREATLAHNLQ